ncbi:hypothetical protein SAMN05421837_10539 [Amycolatopsis pretoriensis]|uniref:Uncharacterized protein n=1 Tax=Amycolatopsis pretoriensis TaxID=218821 RepID=A0A1H5QVT3_9PSEU|nr:hypothetical protein SAMN05421837_10539 [Amycolatopsis pretoriensis]
MTTNDSGAWHCDMQRQAEEAERARREAAAQAKRENR